MLDRCPHRDLRLSGGLVRDGLLTCPGHFWRFSLDDGRRTDLPTEQVSLYPTETDDQGWVWALVPVPAERVSIRQWLLEQARAGSPESRMPD
jgi:nitrite reductase/ring-hydroxylating ferredoxin subunit